MQKIFSLLFLPLFFSCQPKRPPKIQMLDSEAIMSYWGAWAEAHPDTTRLRTFQDSMAQFDAYVNAKPLLSDSMDVAFRKSHLGESAILIVKDASGKPDHYFFYKWCEKQRDSVQVWFQADNKVHLTYYAGIDVPSHLLVETDPGWFRSNGDIVTLHAPEGQNY